MPRLARSALLALADDYGVLGAAMLNLSGAGVGHAGLMLSRVDARALALAAGRRIGRSDAAPLNRAPVDSGGGRGMPAPLDNPRQTR